MNAYLAIRLRRSLVAILIVYWVALVLGTHWPRLPEVGPGISDKFLHVIAYTGLSLLLALCATWGRPASWWRYGAIFLVLATFGGIDELTQPPFGRAADWHDWYADLAGIA